MAARGSLNPTRLEKLERLRELWTQFGTSLTDLQYASRLGVATEGTIQDYRRELGLRRPLGRKSGARREWTEDRRTDPLRIILPNGDVLDGPTAEVLAEARRRRAEAAA